MYPLLLYNMDETIKIQTTDNQIITINTKFTKESDLIQYLLTCEKDENPIKMNISSEYLEIIHTYMKYSYSHKSNIDLIEKPAMKSISEYFSDDWYNQFFPNTLLKCQMLYDSANYLLMTELCKIIVGHIGFMLNHLEDRNQINQVILLPEDIPFNETLKRVYHIDQNKFINMTEDDILKYIKDQAKKWKLCI